MPEIRRYSRSKESMHDQRLDEVFKLELEGGELRFDLDAFHERWMERSCMNEGDATWS